jgi:putative DNA methylase
MSGTRKKLIEVALPLEAINKEASLRKRKAPAGYPTTIHKWWAQRPVAACRAVLFASIVDDPASRPDEFATEEEQERERQRLFRIIEQLIKWENSTNEKVLETARKEIRKAIGTRPTSVLDPFCGGGSIPLEAQRLGLDVYASDLNPVAVLVTKALVEIPPKFAGQPPLSPEVRKRLAHGGSWTRAQGLAEDVRYYGRWITAQAFERIGHLYPMATLPSGGEVTVVAWLWARTVQCPNPACGARMPVVRSFALSTRRGKEVSVIPLIDRASRTVRFDVRIGHPTHQGTKQRGRTQCLICSMVLTDTLLRDQAVTYGIGEQLMTIVGGRERGRLYLAPQEEHELRVEAPDTTWLEQRMPENARWFSPPGYGLTTYQDIFTPRQLIALKTFSDLISGAHDRVIDDGADVAYAEAISTYLALALSRAADYGNALASWRSKDSAMRSLYTQQAIPMVWDFAEGNPFASSSSGFEECVEVVARCLERIPARGVAVTNQLDAAAAVGEAKDALVCTDPPYYDNIGYADLADFFYIWLRRSVGAIYPDLFSTLLTPKVEELVASPYRFDGDRGQAERFFERGLHHAFGKMREVHDADYPLILFYAFKQAEADGGAGSLASTGWDTMLTGLLASGLCVTGTWPMRTEGDNRNVSIGTNALASSIVLVCRPRAMNASLATRRDFINALRAELPDALQMLQRGNIAPVDLAQASIGPGMAIFSRYTKVVEADGTPMSVRTALGQINQVLDEILAAQEGDFDADTRFAVTWFEQRGMTEGPYGEADVLARAKNTSAAGMEAAGVLHSRAGKVRLLNREELNVGWDPAADRRITVWEVTQHLIKRLEKGGEDAAADLLRRVGGLGETARQLAYRLYTTCERKGWVQEALSYNALVVAWPEIARRVAGTPEAEAQQALEV